VRTCFIILGLLIMAGCAKHPRYDSAPLVSLALDESIPEEHRELIDLDLRTASWANITETEEAATIGMNDFSRESLSGWLGERVQGIIGADFEPERLGSARPNVTYRPEVFESLILINMLNYGAGLYKGGKDQKILVTLNVAGREFVVSSPRVGILQVGPGLFSETLADAFGGNNSLASSFRRLQTLFHEARHSDGNGKDLAFEHVFCESGPYKGRPACDRFSNGAYTVGRIMLERFYPLCDECTDYERESLALLIADLRTRVVADTVGDARPERTTL